MARTKKDFDKESMFSKIMPTGKPDIEEEIAPPEHITLPPPSATPIAPVVTNPHISVISHSTPSGGAARIHNIMEDVVQQKVDDVLERFNCCKCELCKQDVIAIALNNLPPRYISANEQKMSAKIQMTMVKAANDANAALVKAAIVVRNSPRHINL